MLNNPDLTIDSSDLAWTLQPPDESLRETRIHTPGGIGRRQYIRDDTPLRRGSCGMVHKGIDVHTSNYIAIKTIAQRSDRFKTEVKSLERYKVSPLRCKANVRLD